MTQRKPIVIVGAGGLGREIRFLIREIDKATLSWNFLGFYDDHVPKNTLVNHSPVLGTLEDLNNCKEPVAVVIAVGHSILRKQMRDRLSNDLLYYPVLVHPTAYIGETEFVELGEGCMITAGVIMTTNIQVGKHVLLNNAVHIGHDTVLEDYVSIMPGANLSGHVYVEEAAFIGTGANLINAVRVGKETIIGAGAAVVDSIPSFCTAVGVPAKPLEK